MAQNDLYEAMFRRKSVRKYAPGKLDQTVMEKVVAHLAELRPLFPEIRIELKVMTNQEVKGMFKVDAPHFLAFFSEVANESAINAGFMMQQMDLFFSANGIGSCWQGGPKPMKESMKVSKLEYVTMLAFGPPAEDIYRKSVAEFKREPLANISDVKGHDDLLEPARLAPSGANNQPWFFTGGNGSIHVSYAKSMVVDRMNQISSGIALCHLWLAAVHSGGKVELRNDRSEEANPPKKYSYAASMIIG
ncbi:MAG: hypothetical protein LUO85_04820 [Methanomassiliicoccales archaeon]|nr:hypothetical protein [Methanomassiliicoccales archaeon]